jgi:alanyl aminopeptidase
MKRALASGLGLVLLVLACGPEAASPRPPLVTATATASARAPVPPPPAPRADGRLPMVARPLRYALRLNVDPRKDSFSGSEDLLLDVLEPTAHVVLNARGETVKRATLTVGGETLALTTTTRASHGALEPDEMVFSADRVVPKGRAKLSIEYDAPFGKTLSGLYRARDAGDTYAFTQFEAADARRAFPCFDEPGYKTPFDVSLTVPTGMLALSNGVETSHGPSGDETTFTFSTTAPLPTYLVAFAVGHFDVVEGPKTTPPIRFVTTHGRGAFARAALKVAGDVVPLLAKYFGIAYPYDKLDLVAVPDFGAGGMENAGLITFRDDSVLMDDGASLRQKRRLVGLMTHELAHQWFGDLVTMKWWDDLWLNEGFATWTTYKIDAEYKPELGSKIDAAASATYIMDDDGLASARAIRQPVASVGQAMQAFDGITYQKGAAVLRMIEHWAGDDAFQKGVHAYLKGHAFGNATAGDLLSAIDAASGKNASDLSRMFLDRPGVPLVVVDSVDCGKKRVTISAHEERWAPLGASFGNEPVTKWNVPFCVEGDGRGPVTACSTFDDKVKLALDGGCPAFGNPDAMGYYRVAWPDNAVARIAKKLGDPSPETRIAALADAWAEARAGKLDGKTLLRDVLPAVDRESERHVVDRLVSVLFDLSEVVDDATWPAFARYAHARIAPHLARLERAHKLDDDDKLLRRTLAWADVSLGDDDALAKRLQRVAKAWAAGDKSIDADWGQVATEIAARFETPAELQHAVETASTPQAHARALRAASGVVAPDAVRAQLDWMLSPKVKLQDARWILWPLAEHHASRKTTLAWARAHWDALRAKLPGHLSSGLVGLAGFACTQAALDDSRAFYTPKAASLEGADRRLAQSLESASLCVALRSKLLPEMKTALGGGAQRSARR